MRKNLALCIFLVLGGCATAEQPDPAVEQPDINGEMDQSEEEETAGIEVIAENLEIPWSIEKANDTFYLTERPGAIVKIENGEIERQEVQLEEDVATAAEAGLLGLALASDFSDSNLAFAYYTYEDSSGQFNRIVTLRLNENTWVEESVLLDQIPSGTYHHGGRLEIGPDEMLYATAGDASDPDLAQDLASIGGSILRMNLDGTIPEGNPDPDSYIYSYGHRNPQGLTWSTEGTLYSSEHGASANDEINKIEGGQNYGWPIIQGTEEEEGMISPLFTSGATDTWAPSGVAYANGKLYVAALRGEAVIEFDLETGKQRKVITDYGRIRDVLIEDDTLYFISNNTDGRGEPQENDDKLYKVSLTELNEGE